MKQFLILFSFLLVFISLDLHAVVWPTENEWSPEMEKRYASWVENDWDEKVFIRKDSLVYNVKTDCADAAYAMRVTFSYLNKLPFKIHNRDPKNPNKYITNTTRQFDYIKNDHSRFITFLYYVLEYTSSRTIPEDTYPIAINRASLTPGTIYVSPDDHTMEIKSVSEFGVATTFWSTVPRIVRQLEFSNDWPFYAPEAENMHRDGYRAFKEPDQFDLPENSLPNYSLEQYEISKQVNADEEKFISIITERMKLRGLSINERVNIVFKNLCWKLYERANEVSLAISNQTPGQCFNKSEYNEYSTPHRDLKIKENFALLKNIYDSAEYKSNVDEIERRNILYALFNKDQSYDQELKFVCSIPTYNDYLLLHNDDGTLNSHASVSAEYRVLERISLKEVLNAINSNTLISDPNATAAERWGLGKQECEEKARLNGKSPRSGLCAKDYHPKCPQY